MAVTPGRQKQGTGTTLVRACLARCAELGIGFVVVLGHPHYYPRFGFVPATRFGLHCAWPVPDDVFMALEMRPGALAATSGLVEYELEFNDV